MFGWFKKEDKTNKEIAIQKFKKVGLTFEEADYLAQDVAELSLYADNNLFNGDEDNVNSLEEAYKDKYYMSTVDSISSGDLPIKDIAHTGIQARAMGLDFELRTAIKKSIFEYLERENLDNTHYREEFLQTLSTVTQEEDKENISSIIDFLYINAWIKDKNNQRHHKSINKMVTKLGVDGTLKNFKNLLFEGDGWYSQVNNPNSQLQKITSLSLTWLGGKLEEIKNRILHDNLTPFDILLDTDKYQEEVYIALNEAEEKGGFPKLEDNYRTEVAGRFLQYMQEEVRLNILNNKQDYDSIENIQHIINRLNLAELDYQDIEDIYLSPSVNDVTLTIEMNNEENFLLSFETQKDMKIALDLIHYKMNILLTNNKQNHFNMMGLNELLIDFKKMLFEDFINQYDLDVEQVSSLYRWQEQNNERERKEKIVDFSNYSLRFMRASERLQAILINQTEEEIAQEERKKQELDEIPF